MERTSCSKINYHLPGERLGKECSIKRVAAMGLMVAEGRSGAAKINNDRNHLSNYKFSVSHPTFIHLMQ